MNREMFRSIKLLDWLILIIAVMLLSSMNFDDLHIADCIYLATFTIWFFSVGLRIYLDYKRQFDAVSGNGQARNPARQQKKALKRQREQEKLGKNHKKQ